jgi:hypothetical protein
MDITQLTQAMHDFVHTMGWYETNSPRPQTMRNLAISLNLEASEVLEHFQWDESLKDPDSFSDEKKLSSQLGCQGINDEHSHYRFRRLAA